MVLFCLHAHSKFDYDRLRRLLFDRVVTRDTDKPEIQPVSEPESRHSCVFS